ncbi:MAG: tetratricopeptide repeat protein [Phormidium tanganyikae FI6-MK23]|jgi:tetratricopeptide (TPR) repeat protein|nr:tetratricopeptide repeat protein [Phormidium tanganyikae FI6-MK23]
MTDERFDIDAQGNARVNAIGKLYAEKVEFGDRVTVQQRVSVIGLDPIPPEHKADEWIDRTEPQRELLQRIQAQARLIELVAVGGFGKSLLAGWLFHRIEGEFERSLWLNFRKVPTFNEFARWVLQEIGFLIDDPRVTDEALSVELAYRLTGKRCLVVLDQLEAVQNANDRASFEQFLQTWQNRGRSSVVLVTTRSTFGVTGRDRVELAGLAEDEGAAFLRKQGIQTRDEAQVCELVRMAEGHPLLLNLAASWMRQEAQGELRADGLEFFKRLFRQYKGNAEAKVEEIFAQLFAELPERLRSLLLGVVVYRDPFGLEMAQAMLADASIEDLRSLGERTFLREESERWTLHPLMRGLVEQKLKESDRHREAHQNAIAYFLLHLKPSVSSIEDCTERLEVFYHWCKLEKYAIADQMMDTCVNFLDRRGYYRNLLPIYEQLTQAWTVVNPNDVEEQRNLGWAWTRLGGLYHSVGQYQDAVDAYELARTMFDKIEFSQGKANALTNLGLAYHSLRKDKLAIEVLQQSLEIVRAIGNRQNEAYALGSLGIAYFSVEQYPLAIDCYQQWLEIARTIRDPRSEANALSNLGFAYSCVSQYRLSLKSHQRALEIVRTLDEPRAEAVFWFNLGRTLAKFNRQKKSIKAFQNARRSYQRMELDRDVENCDDAIQKLRRKSKIDWVLWVCVGVAIVLLIAWLRK